MFTTQRAMKKKIGHGLYSILACPLPQTEGMYKQRAFCTGKIWKLIKLCCLSKLEVELNHMSLYKKKKTDGSFWVFKEESIGQQKTYLKTHGPFVVCETCKPNIASARGMLLWLATIS